MPTISPKKIYKKIDEWNQKNHENKLEYTETTGKGGNLIQKNTNKKILAGLDRKTTLKILTANQRINQKRNE